MRRSDGWPSKRDAEHVPDLAFVPVGRGATGGWPTAPEAESSDSPHLDAQVLVPLIGEQVIENGENRCRAGRRDACGSAHRWPSGRTACRTAGPTSVFRNFRTAGRRSPEVHRVGNPATGVLRGKRRRRRSGLRARLPPRARHSSVEPALLRVDAAPRRLPEPVFHATQSIPACPDGHPCRDSCRRAGRSLSIGLSDFIRRAQAGGAHAVGPLQVAHHPAAYPCRTPWGPPPSSSAAGARCPRPSANNVKASRKAKGLGGHPGT